MSNNDAYYDNQMAHMKKAVDEDDMDRVLGVLDHALAESLNPLEAIKGLSDAALRAKKGRS